MRGAKDCGVVLEINDHSWMAQETAECGGNDTEMLRWCMKYQVPVVLNSDAHTDTKVGSHEHAWALVKQLEFPEELILNTNLEKFKTYVNCYHLGKR